jgi:hypothetical protein
MVGKPRFMGDPAQHQQQRHQPPDHKHADRDKHYQARQQEEALVPAMT